MVSSYESGDGTKVQNAGDLKNVRVPDIDESGRQIGEKDSVVSVQSGVISYIAPDGSTINLRYTADEFGFHPEGLHLPIAPVA